MTTIPPASPSLSEPMPPCEPAQKPRTGKILGVVFAVLVLLVLLAVGGWFAAHAYATKEAKKHLDDQIFALMHSPEGADISITYKDISATPFGDFSVDQISIAHTDLPFPVTIERISGSGIQTSAQLDHDSKLNIANITIPIDPTKVTDPETRRHLELSPLYAMGYSELVFNVGYESYYDHALGNSETTLTIALKDAATFSMTLGLSEVDMSALLMLPASPSSASAAQSKLVWQRRVLAFMESNPNMKVATLAISGDTTELYKRLTATRQVYDKFLLDMTPIATSVNTVPFLILNQSPDEAEHSVILLRSWLVSGGAISLKSENSEPVLLISPNDPTPGLSALQGLKLRLRDKI